MEKPPRHRPKSLDGLTGSSHFCPRLPLLSSQSLRPATLSLPSLARARSSSAPAPPPPGGQGHGQPRDPALGLCPGPLPGGTTVQPLTHSGKSRRLGLELQRFLSSCCRLGRTLWVWVGAGVGDGVLPWWPCLSQPQRRGCLVPGARPAPREPSSVPPAGPPTSLCTTARRPSPSLPRPCFRGGGHGLAPGHRMEDLSVLPLCPRSPACASDGVSSVLPVLLPGSVTSSLEECRKGGPACVHVRVWRPPGAWGPQEF